MSDKKNSESKKKVEPQIVFVNEYKRIIRDRGLEVPELGKSALEELEIPA